MVNIAFDVPVRGSLPLLLGVALLYIFVELGKGMVISVISKTQQQAFLLVMMIAMADFMFTGYAAPVEGMPEIVQIVAKFIPAHHWLEIMRAIMIKGAGLECHLAACAGTDLTRTGDWQIFLALYPSSIGLEI